MSTNATFVMSNNITCPATVRDMDVPFFACASGYSPNQTAAMEACCNGTPIVRYGENLCWQYCNVSSRAAERTWFACWGDQNVRIGAGIAVCFNFADSAAPSVRPSVSKAGLAIISLVFAGVVGGLMV
ncbi:hypothetical protein MMC30_009173 [Trapelia coarctata]|nr:hypothetical protein [Trapelia coarctata]